MKKIDKLTITNIILCAIIVIIAFSNIFYKFFDKVFYLDPHLESCATQIHFIDVGQGDAIGIKFSNGKIMLVDSGTADYQKKLDNYLENVLLDKDKTIDYLVLTHPDSDHSGNMEYIINKYEVGVFYRPKIYESYENLSPSVTNIHYRNALKALSNKNIDIKYNEHGNQIVDGNLQIDWIVPQDLEDIAESGETNDLSPIMIITDDNIKTMLTGDISSEVESLVIQGSQNGLFDIDIDILKLAHHGSKYSNSYEFLKATTPRYVVAGVGENTYGHPANEVIERLLKYDEEFDKDLYSNFKNTKEDGNIIYTYADKIEVNTIKNIDDYAFISYFMYSFIAIIFLTIIVIMPYIKILIKNVKFLVRNKKHKEQNIQNN